MNAMRTFLHPIVSLAGIALLMCGLFTGCESGIVVGDNNYQGEVQTTEPQKSGETGPVESNQETASDKTTPAETTSADRTDPSEKAVLETATFAGGCFWCVEAVFQKLEGVSTVVPGYMGGATKNPTYYEVCSGTTGHAEVIQIKFDPKKISFEELLSVFFQTHDPTTLNRQGNDKGTQYRSAVFYHSDAQMKIAQKVKEKLDENEAFPRPIVTEITKAAEMYVAENNHHNYFNENPNDGYCQFAIPPKLEKLKKVFGDKLKKK